VYPYQITAALSTGKAIIPKEKAPDLSRAFGFTRTVPDY
jgi:hypothetical protein